jgi:hypothetical protein
MDGNWKLGRPKCLCGDENYEVEEFGIIPTGCRLTPIRNSYYCHLHKSADIRFKYNNKIIAINPTLIKSNKLDDEETIKCIYDMWISPKDIQLFLVKTSKNQMKWLTTSQITKLEYNKFIETYTSVQDDHIANCVKTCNTLKTQPCLLKCKTRGILLAVSNCGVVMSFRELFGGESLSQGI